MKTPITYYGGKQYMLNRIMPLIPGHTLYCEPFAGGAAVFFAKQPAAVNVINDLNGELVNFYRVAGLQPGKLRKEISVALHSREQFEHARYIYRNPGFFTPVQRAGALWMLSKVSFAAKLGDAFGFDKSVSKHPRKLRNAKLAFSDELTGLLEKATIECDDALKVIKRYDSPGAFFFLDPPYVGTDMGHYKGIFSGRDLSGLLELCKTIRGKFMLTAYPNERIRDLAERHGWVIHKAERLLPASKSRKKQEEWIVCNYTML